MSFLGFSQFTKNYQCRLLTGASTNSQKHQQLSISKKLILQGFLIKFSIHKNKYKISKKFIKNENSKEKNVTKQQSRRKFPRQNTRKKY